MNFELVDSGDVNGSNRKFRLFGLAKAGIMKNLIKSSVGFALLATSWTILSLSQQPSWRPVDDRLFAEIRGGACDNKFTYRNDDPVYCSGRDVGCHATMPNSVSMGETGSKEESCGAATGCGTFTGPTDCAQVGTSTSAIFVP
jgi:hypothetical protein